MTLLTILVFHVFMAWLCAYRYTQAYRRSCGYKEFAMDRFVWGLLGMWIVVPESWDNSWMDKYKEETK